jgi:hypothetical protein
MWTIRLQKRCSILQLLAWLRGTSAAHLRLAAAAALAAGKLRHHHPKHHTAAEQFNTKAVRKAKQAWDGGVQRAPL